LRGRGPSSSTTPSALLSAERTPNAASTEQAGRRTLSTVDRTASVAEDARSSETLDHEIQRLSAHIESLKNRLSQLGNVPNSVLHSDTATQSTPSLINTAMEESVSRRVRRSAEQERLIAGSFEQSSSSEQTRSWEPLARPSGSFEQSSSAEQTRSREPLARPSGSFEQSSSSEQTRSWEPLARPSGSFEQSSSAEQTRSREPLARPSGSFEQSSSAEQTRSREPLARPSGSFEQARSDELTGIIGTGTEKAKVSTKQGRESPSVPYSADGRSYESRAEKPPAITLEKYDGKSCLETYLAKFTYVSDYFEWSAKQKLLYLRTNLEGAAGELLWMHPEVKTVEDVIDLLQNRFGTRHQRERFRVESRRRKNGEELQGLFQDIVRLLSLAYPNEVSEAVNVIARDAFLQALDDPEFHLRILERDPATIDDVLRIAVQLEAYEKSVISAGTCETKFKRNKNPVRTIGATASPMHEVNEKFDLIMAQLSELKTENAKLKTQME
jgi:hypothetical protein